MLSLIVHLQAKLQDQFELETLLQQLVRLAAAEPGTLAYIVQRPREQDHRITLYEVYRDQASLDAHMSNEEVRGLLARFETVLSEPPQVILGDLLAQSGLSGV
jgi:quinol monooxygenase YgiN